MLVGISSTDVEKDSVVGNMDDELCKYVVSGVVDDDILGDVSIGAVVEVSIDGAGVSLAAVFVVLLGTSNGVVVEGIVDCSGVGELLTGISG